MLRQSCLRTRIVFLKSFLRRREKKVLWYSWMGDSSWHNRSYRWKMKFIGRILGSDWNSSTVPTIFSFLWQCLRNYFLPDISQHKALSHKQIDENGNTRFSFKITYRTFTLFLERKLDFCLKPDSPPSLSTLPCPFHLFRCFHSGITHSFPPDQGSAVRNGK